MKRIKAELMDKVYYLFRAYNDRMAHAALYYPIRLDRPALTEAAAYLCEKIPLLHSAFIDNGISPYWRVMPYCKEALVDFREAEDLTAASEAYLAETVIPVRDPLQFRLTVFENDGGSALCLVMNHMLLDGKDFGYVLQKLAACYHAFRTEGKCEVAVKNGSRSNLRLYTGFSKADAKKAKRLYSNPSVAGSRAFPTAPVSDGDRPFLVRYTADSETFRAMKAAGKAMGATVNDVLMAACAQAFYEVTGQSAAEPFHLSYAIDMRKYISDRESHGITSYSSFIWCTVQEKGRDIRELLAAVTESTRATKADPFAGLYGLPLLRLAYRIMPFAFSERAIRAGYSNPLVSISNVGVTDAAALALDGAAPTDGCMFGPVRVKPAVQITVTSMNGVVSCVSALIGNAEDRAMLERFFGRMDAAIRELIG